MTKWQEIYYFYKNRGFCTRCKKRPAFKGKTLCARCLELNAAYNANRDNAALNQRFHERRERLKATGICIDCGRKPARPGQVRCEDCARKCRIKMRQYNAAHHVWRPDGICIRRGCGKPVVPGMRTCPEHYAEKCAQAARMREHCDRKNHVWRRSTRENVEKCT